MIAEGQCVVIEIIAYRWSVQTTIKWTLRWTSVNHTCNKPFINYSFKRWHISIWWCTIVFDAAARAVNYEWTEWKEETKKNRTTPNEENGQPSATDCKPMTENMIIYITWIPYLLEEEKSSSLIFPTHHLCSLGFGVVTCCQIGRVQVLNIETSLALHFNGVCHFIHPIFPVWTTKRRLMMLWQINLEKTKKKEKEKRPTEQDAYIKYARAIAHPIANKKKTLSFQKNRFRRQAT